MEGITSVAFPRVEPLSVCLHFVLFAFYGVSRYMHGRDILEMFGASKASRAAIEIFLEDVP